MEAKNEAPTSRSRALLEGLIGFAALAAIGAMAWQSFRSDAAPVAPAPSAATSSAMEAAPTPAAPAPEALADVSATRKELEKAALAGDYQAQRNLAYSLGHDFPPQQIHACAWRIVILDSGSKLVDDSDVGNKQADCDRKLSPDGIYAASMRAAKLEEQITTSR